MIRTIARILLLSCWLIGAPALSDDKLRDLREFGVLIESLDADAAGCGIEEATLDTSLRFIVNQSRIKLVPERIGADGYIYLQVTVLRNCTAHVQLEVNARVRSIKTSQVFMATVWDKGKLLTGSNPRQATSAAVEELGKKLVNDWTAANR